MRSSSMNGSCAPRSAAPKRNDTIASRIVDIDANSRAPRPLMATDAEMTMAK